PLALGVGQSVRVNVAFTPQSAGTAGGSLLVSGPALAIPLTGTGTAHTASTTAGQLSANPASLTFGSAQVGSSLTLMESLTNTGGSSVTISQATATGTGFSISGLNVPLVLNPGASVTFSAVFAPQSAVNATGGITVGSNASNSTLTVSLSGAGTAQGQLTLAPTALNFGNATVGTNVSQTSSLSAGGASVTVSSASLSSAEFSLTGISFPVTIAAGQSVPVTMTFSPQASGSASGVLSVASNASNAPTQSLSGVGVAPAQHSVSLSWTDTSSGIAGYNVYRGNASGGPFTQINSGLDTAAAYSDTSVVAGQTYYYVTTAVNDSGAESAYSNEAQGVIPSS
ncbi:MAG: choice-of-anchor D domain-containing protein, partial [Terriglobales bacterium]